MTNVFHNAIPTHDLDAAADFYTNVLGARVARRYDDRVTLNFFDHQVVCHLNPEEIDHDVKMYPRHFGMTFYSGDDFDALYKRVKSSGCELYRDLFERFAERPERHRTFFIVDPSNNVIEFKHYDDPQFMY